jgi:hypothetical protein
VGGDAIQDDKAWSARCPARRKRRQQERRAWYKYPPSSLCSIIKKNVETYKIYIFEGLALGDGPGSRVLRPAGGPGTLGGVPTRSKSTRPRQRRTGTEKRFLRRPRPYALVSVCGAFPEIGDVSTTGCAWATPGDISLGGSQAHLLPIRNSAHCHPARGSRATGWRGDIASRPVERHACSTMSWPTCHPTRQFPPIRRGVAHAAIPCGNPL